MIDFDARDNPLCPRIWRNLKFSRGEFLRANRRRSYGSTNLFSETRRGIVARIRLAGFAE